MPTCRAEVRGTGRARSTRSVAVASTTATASSQSGATARALELVDAEGRRLRHNHIRTGAADAGLPPARTPTPVTPGQTRGTPGSAGGSWSGRRDSISRPSPWQGRARRASPRPETVAAQRIPVGAHAAGHTPGHKCGDGDHPYPGVLSRPPRCRPLGSPGATRSRRRRSSTATAVGSRRDPATPPVGGRRFGQADSRRGRSSARWNSTRCPTAAA